MSTLVSIDFSGTITTDFNGSTSVANYTGGDLQFTNEGAILAKTTVGTGDKWLRFKATTLYNEGPTNTGFALGDSSGNCFIWGVSRLTTNLRIDSAWKYATYSSWLDQDVNIGESVAAFSEGQFIGVTFAPATNTVRVWANVSAATPDSVTSWDSSAADWSSTAATFYANSNYVGMGCSSSGNYDHSYDDFTAGDFGSSQSNAPRVTRHLQNMMRG